MKILKYPLWIVYRVWFYILVALPIVILLPILLVVISRDQWYPAFFKLARFWAKFILIGMGMRWKIRREQITENKKSYMFIGNHTSMMDIMLMLVTVRTNPFVFVGKKELVKIPVFGFFYKKVVIMVDRDNPKSRKEVYNRAKSKLKNGTSIAIFPEGLVPTENIVLAPFKNGAFSLAIQHKIPIVPHVYYDCKRLFSWDFFKGHPGTLRIKQCKFIQTDTLTIEVKNDLKEKTFSLLYNELKNDELYMSCLLYTSDAADE